jgi:hypothetical protein
MRRRAVKGVDERRDEGGGCQGVVGGGHVLSRSGCLKPTRLGSAAVRYNGRELRVLSSLLRLRRCVYGCFSWADRYYLRKGWAGSQLLHSVCGGSQARRRRFSRIMGCSYMMV